MKNPIANLQGSKRDRTRDQLLISTQALLQKYNAAELRINQVADNAGLVPASFYNYYPDVTALINDLGELLAATHAAAIAQLVSPNDSPSTRFARITRETLRVVAQQPFFGRLMFDVGLPIDRPDGYLRRSLHSDIEQGITTGTFAAADVDVAVSLASGAIQGIGLDIHRGLIPPAKIDAITARLLIGLGVAAVEAEHLAFTPIPTLPPAELPMRWLALPPAFLSLTDTGSLGANYEHDALLFASSTAN